LANRRLLQDRLDRALTTSKRNGRFIALMFIDLDNFKTLNDKHGHNMGDLLLIETAKRISACVREVDTVSRFGGDEFVVMLNELDLEKDSSKSQAAIVAEKIRHALLEPYRLTVKQPDGTETTVEHGCTSSIGGVVFTSQERTAEEALKLADIAMYRSKESGRNCVTFYE
jgi:diguanylate cyclase (GGDEF)-like protein